MAGPLSVAYIDLCHIRMDWRRNFSADQEGDMWEDCVYQLAPQCGDQNQIKNAFHIWNKADFIVALQSCLEIPIFLLSAL